MTSRDSLDIREVIFVNTRCRVDYEAMPADVRESADQAIDALQNARPLPPKLYQRLHDKLADVHEIRLPRDDNAWSVWKCATRMRARIARRTELISKQTMTNGKRGARS